MTIPHVYDSYIQATQSESCDIPRDALVLPASPSLTLWSLSFCRVLGEYYFRQVTYPLNERGVVLLRGSNLDDSGADSNGAGKTTLAMSALWALAGVVDARYITKRKYQARKAQTNTHQHTHQHTLTNTTIKTPTIPDCCQGRASFRRREPSLHAARESFLNLCDGTGNNR